MYNINLQLNSITWKVFNPSFRPFQCQRLGSPQIIFVQCGMSFSAIHELILFSLSDLFIIFYAILISIISYKFLQRLLLRCKEVVMATVRAIFDIVDTSTNQVSACQISWFLGKVNLPLPFPPPPFPEINHLLNYWVFFPQYYPPHHHF